MFLPPTDGCPTATAAVASTATAAASVPSTVLRTVVMSCVLPSLRDSPRTSLCAGPASPASPGCCMLLAGDVSPRPPVPGEDFAEGGKARDGGLFEERDALLRLQRHGLAPDRTAGDEAHGTGLERDLDPLEELVDADARREQSPRDVAEGLGDRSTAVRAAGPLELQEVGPERRHLRRGLDHDRPGGLGREGRLTREPRDQRLDHTREPR